MDTRITRSLLESIYDSSQFNNLSDTRSLELFSWSRTFCTVTA